MRSRSAAIVHVVDRGRHSICFRRRSSLGLLTKLKLFSFVINTAQFAGRTIPKLRRHENIARCPLTVPCGWRSNSTIITLRIRLPSFPSYLVVLSVTDTQESKGLTIPLTRRTPVSLLTVDEIGAWAKEQGDLLRSKYGIDTVAKRATGSNALVNQNQDTSYYGSLALGTPPKSFNVILDTCVNSFGLPSHRCLHRVWSTEVALISGLRRQIVSPDVEVFPLSTQLHHQRSKISLLRSKLPTGLVPQKER